MPRRYPPEFRSRLLALLDVGRSVTDVAAELGVSGQTIYDWRNHAGFPDQADAGTRTPDPIITSDVLYQLSYVGVTGARAAVEATG